MPDNQNGVDLHRKVEHHDRDLYRGDQRKAGLTTRMEQMEEWKESLNAQLNGEYGKPGLISQMQAFFAVQAERAKTDKKREKHYVAIVGGLAILVPILYDVIKHKMGWK